ncbi:hypothetical protein THERMOT_1084 [Bathymodiolus thermophilus thioautotrophic gill symbiont]|uniref:hypothetical protein n=1 Tax=Bathymodiolus thermophilus thioautotrophic gill symbiont TaxID=2360 RepID=UPI00192C28DC|nr:hypothetical protein [Bathymodiolus thermophilus thioautotrophic gill symbiont]CAB5499623.1 hypothetical protein THERMOT_1084 [Bathymodiolus thermophilus thioautotrophic gill symbiont]
MTFNVSNEFKRSAILIIVNIGIIFAIYSVFSKKFYEINLPYLEQKFNNEKAFIGDLQQQLRNLKGVLTVNKANLTKQMLIFKTIVSAFDDVKIVAFDTNSKGFVYAISGNTKSIVLLSYKVNRAIVNHAIRAQIQKLLVKNGSSVLKVQIFGVNND